MLNPTALYLGDNGRCFCGKHAGATAQATGRDLSGQKVHKLNAADMEYAKRELGVSFKCESCKAN